MLTVTDLTKTYHTVEGSVPVLRGINLSVQPGESVALMGESGSGKSTLLHLIGGLDQADGGEIIFESRSVTDLNDAGRAALRKTALGIIFQQFNLIPSMTVGANLAFQARLAGTWDAEWQAELTSRLGLTDLTHRYPEALSGGQQQRVAIGRTLAGRPKLILADEPTGNLDEATGDAVLNLALSLVKDVGSSFLMVTHSTRLAALLDRRVTLSRGQIHEVVG